VPRATPTEYLALPLEARAVVPGFDLHDVWEVDLGDARRWTLPELRDRLFSRRRDSLPFPVRALFGIRKALGSLLRLDGPRDVAPRSELTTAVPEALANCSSTRPGTPEGPFTTLYVLDDEAAYEALNATVHAILVIALVETEGGQRFLWATHLRPVGLVTAVYMGLIDPFRRWIVYPGLERWLRRSVENPSA
jgi:hypothetical protein